MKRRIPSRVNVSSAAIASIGHDAETRLLEIEFQPEPGRPGRVYLYRDVPRHVYHDLLAAPSAGTYFARNVRNFYPFQRSR